MLTYDDRHRYLAIPPICGMEWLEKHTDDHTQDEINNLGMELITDRQRVTVKAGMKATNLRTALKAITGVR
jgi:hypothetical protein